MHIKTHFINALYLSSLWSDLSSAVEHVIAGAPAGWWLFWDNSDFSIKSGPFHYFRWKYFLRSVQATDDKKPVCCDEIHPGENQPGDTPELGLQEDCKETQAET